MKNGKIIIAILSIITIVISSCGDKNSAKAKKRKARKVKE
jgi:hypothetical protein